MKKPFVYKTKAHPTRYEGVQFRSRLEARWAAYFDLIGWGWEYEPVDLNGWVPDFRLTLPPTKTHPDEYYGVKYVRDHRPFVEIKPVESLGDFPLEKIEASVGHAETEVLLLGVNPDFAWRVPDASWYDAMDLMGLGGRAQWREAGNLTQWKPR